jgi:hypothetical protein
MADVAKRENHLTQARRCFKRVISLQPTCAQAWLEYAKMEEVTLLLLFFFFYLSSVCFCIPPELTIVLPALVLPLTGSSV